MKKTAIISGFLATLFFLSCHRDKKPTPEDNRQYSYWTVNEDSFSTNHVETAIGKARVDLYSEGFVNRFSMTFNFGYELPKNGSFPLAKVPTDDPNIVGIGFYYNTVHYIPSPSSNSVLSAASINNKARYTLPPTWFINYDNHSDSALISGTFNEP